MAARTAKRSHIPSSTKRIQAGSAKFRRAQPVNVKQAAAGKPSRTGVLLFAAALIALIIAYFQYPLFTRSPIQQQIEEQHEGGEYRQPYDRVEAPAGEAGPAPLEDQSGPQPAPAP